MLQIAKSASEALRAKKGPAILPADEAAQPVDGNLLNGKGRMLMASALVKFPGPRLLSGDGLGPRRIRGRLLPGSGRPRSLMECDQTQRGELFTPALRDLASSRDSMSLTSAAVLPTSLIHLLIFSGEFT